MSKKNAPTDNSQSATHPPKITDTSTAAQRVRLLAHLREYGTVTTHEARDLLNIMSPAPRIMELRQRGHEIITLRINQPDHMGRPHGRIGQYVLMSSQAEG